jgi:hypothetical protein
LDELTVYSLLRLKHSYLIFCFCLSFHSSVVKVRGAKEPVVPAPARQHTDLTLVRLIWLVLCSRPPFCFSPVLTGFVIIQNWEGDVKVIRAYFAASFHLFSIALTSLGKLITNDLYNLLFR